MLLKELMSEAGAFSELEITGVTSDSRKVKKGSAFVCVLGAAADGHDYAKLAYEAGAAVIIAERDTGVAEQIIVDDTHKVYASMCAKWFHSPTDSLSVIGVTGTNGKTSVTYMLKSILEKNGEKVGLIGTIQNMIGDEVFEAKNTTPGIYELQELFYRMKNAGCTYVIMEVSSHALDQRRVEGIHFRLAMFTNLSQDHLDYHKTMDNYLAAKKKLFRMCDMAVINSDDSCYDELVKGLECKVISYSAESDEADYTARNIVYRPDGIVYELVGYGTISRVRVSTGGRFTVYNSMCAGVAAIELGYPIASVSDALAGLRGVKGRAEVVPTDRDFTIIIDYAHTPDGLKNILKTFRECEKNRLVVLFGCGGDRDKTKRPIMGDIAAHYADYVIVTSDNPRSENPTAIIDDILVGMKGTKTPYTVIENRIKAIKYAVKNAQPGDIVVLAGKGHETYQILSTGTIHLDEREVVNEALKEC